jgi:dethiobiotin synthetase
MHYFITGTDTDVGKTWVTASLALGFLKAGKRIAIYKPLQTGVNTPEEGDAYTCKCLLMPFLTSANSDALHVETTYYFSPPAAPSMIEGHEAINLDVIQARFEVLKAAYDVVLVEGAGGLFCPIQANMFMVDLAKSLGLSCLLVTRYTLGTLNHTLLSLEALHQRGIPVHAVVFKEASPLPAVEQESLAVRQVVSELKRHTHSLKNTLILEQGYHAKVLPLVTTFC